MDSSMIDLPRITKEEQKQLEQKSDKICPDCGTIMCIGEAENFGICCNCYTKAYEQDGLI